MVVVLLPPRPVHPENMARQLQQPVPPDLMAVLELPERDLKQPPPVDVVTVLDLVAAVVAVVEQGSAAEVPAR